MEYLCERVCAYVCVLMCRFVTWCLSHTCLYNYISCVCAHLVTAPLTVGPAHWWGRGAEPPCVHSKQGRHMMCMQFCAVVLLTQLLCLLYVLHADQHDSVRTHDRVRMYACAHRCTHVCMQSTFILYFTCNSTVTFISIYVNKDTKCIIYSILKKLNAYVVITYF